jgi:hypothetical protein
VDGYLPFASILSVLPGLPRDAILWFVMNHPECLVNNPFYFLEFLNKIALKKSLKDVRFLTRGLSTTHNGVLVVDVIEISGFMLQNALSLKIPSNFMTFTDCINNTQKYCVSMAMLFDFRSSRPSHKIPSNFMTFTD